MKTKSFRSLWILGLLALSACGKMGPMTIEIQATQPFEVQTPGGAVSFTAGQKSVGVATYSVFGKKLTLELQGQKLIFKKTSADFHQGVILSSPADSGVRTTGGELLGFSSKANLVCNPECEKVERSIFRESCVYYVSVPEVVCHSRWGDHHGRDEHCETVWRSIARNGIQTVEHITRIETYDILGSIFGATAGEMAQTHSAYTSVTEERRPLTPCY